MPVGESVVRCLGALGLLAAPFVILILVAQWRERRGDWMRSRMARGALGGALALEAALDPSRRAAIEYILTEQDEVHEEDEEGQGVPPLPVSPADVAFTRPGPHRFEGEDCTCRSSLEQQKPREAEL